jgi:limonene-1,2-epoxide hydrolase
MRNLANEKLIMDFFRDLEGTMIEDLVAAFKKYFHPEGIWKNSGFPDLKGHDAIAHLLYEQKRLFDFQRVKVLEHRLLTSVDNYVFFERRDSIVNSKDEVVYAFDILGKFVIQDEKVIEWSDYFDSSQVRADWEPGSLKTL